MLLEKLERVNRLRKQAMNDPEFLAAAQEHQKALEHEQTHSEANKPRSRSRSARTLSEIYQGIDVGQHGSTRH
ncbi:hypothetical protein [Vibrio sp. WXL103]|uniref:hypothetical protein n=1 Tax=unclassified Vibrio TaxID=2614977 RepID=UPI003EC51F0E